MIDGVAGPDHGEPHLDAGHRHHLRQHPAGGQIISETKSCTIFQSLPATPYFKMIDIWLFFSMNLMVVSSQRKMWMSQNSDVGRLCVLSSTPTWNTSSKQWRRMRRGTNQLNLRCLRYLFTPKDILLSLKQSQEAKKAASVIAFRHLLSQIYTSVPTYTQSVLMMESDLAISTEDRQSRQCISQCPMTVPGALRVNSLPLSLLLRNNPSSRDRLLFLLGQRPRTSSDWGHVSL